LASKLINTKYYLDYYLGISLVIVFHC